MLTVIHILLALLSILFATFVAVSPTANRFKINFSLILTTVGSGVLLSAMESVSLLRACATGFAYTLVVSALYLVAKNTMKTRVSAYHS